MDKHRKKYYRQQLDERRQNLEKAIANSGQTDHLAGLLKEVDTALEKLDTDAFGLCEVCEEPVEEERLLADPLVCICLDHLTSDQQRTLEEDLKLASLIQNRLLPAQTVRCSGWDIHYIYKPAGIVSGDYLDIICPNEEDSVLYILLGDVSGKGIAASMLMAHIHAIFRSLLASDTPLCQLATQANRIFCESTMSTHYATLVFARIDRSGTVQICNAGHNAPLLVQGENISKVEATGLPLGMFCDAEYTLAEFQLASGDNFLFYTDGLTEAMNKSDAEYGEERLFKLLLASQELNPQELIRTCLQDLGCFQDNSRRIDDLTILGIRRS